MEKPLLLLLLLLFNLANLYTPRGHQKFAKSVVSGRQLVYGAQHSGNNVQENIYKGMKMEEKCYILIIIHEGIKEKLYQFDLIFIL